MSTVFSRLGFSFNTASFGDAHTISAGASKTLNLSPLRVTTWQKEDLANNVVSKSRYFKNPHANICNTIITNINSIYTLMNDADPANTYPLILDSSIQDLKDQANSYIIEISAFKSHTDNVSGLTTPTSSSMTIPTYDLACSYGSQLLRITNTTDGITNTSPILGSMTSLFIGTQLSQHSSNLANDIILINSTDTGPSYNITSSQVQAIKSHMANGALLMSTRRLHDWNFYNTAVSIVTSYNTLSSFDSLTSTQEYLVKNFIGTDTLVNSLANT